MIGKTYKTLALALELDPASDKKIIQKAKEIREQFGTKIILIHSIEHLSSYGAYGISVGVDVEQVLTTEAEKELVEIGKKLDIDAANQVVGIGPAKYVIVEEAKKRKADLIVIGSHGRHGVRLMLGSTANGVLHTAECDVLAVRLPQE